MESPIEVSGVVDRVIFKSDDSGYAVFVLKVDSSKELIACGTVGQLHQGSRVTVKGGWSFHPKFGRQLQVQECFTQLPSTALGIEKYLSSGLIKGIGPKLAQKLVGHFGEKTLEIIDQNPEQLMNVDGVAGKRVATIVAAWQDQKEISRVMVFLRSKDVSPSYAVKIFKAYGNQAVDNITSNPYRLIDDIWGIGFKTADQIALKIGLEQNSPERIKAGILHVISQATDIGNLYIELPDLKKKVTEILNIQSDLADLIKQALTELYQQNKIKLLTYQEKHYLSLPQFYYAERGIAQRLLRLLEKSSTIKALDAHTIYQQLRMPDQQGVLLNEDQQRGIMCCLQNKVTIITGGPGTGKTTLIKRLIQIVEEQGIKFRLAAPTGRAAKRMFESTRKNTETLHRLLEFAPATMNFSRNEQNALELDMLIVDEASMIDVFMMNALLKAMPMQASLLLLGDVDQLPSVGAGNVLNDLIASEKLSVVRLTQIFRQAQDSMIVVNAHRVNRGEFPQSSLPGSKRDFLYIKEETPENIFALLHKLYTFGLSKYGIQADDSIVLVPMNRGIVGTQRLNQELQNILNPGGDQKKQVSLFGQAYKIGDRVMQIKNNYDKFVFNGDMGKIADISQEDQELVVNFGDREIPYDFTELNELTLSYAISIHKSQGSEFGAVIIPIFMQHFVLLERNLIYTAITRAKRLCILIGQPKAIGMGIKNVKGVARLTFLKEFLTSDLQAR